MTEEQELEQLAAEIAALEEQVKGKIEPEPARARDEDGKFKPDDPATPEVNEAWVITETPKPKREKKKKEVAPPVAVAEEKAPEPVKISQTKKESAKVDVLFGMAKMRAKFLNRG